MLVDSGADGTEEVGARQKTAVTGVCVICC